MAVEKITFSEGNEMHFPSQIGIEELAMNWRVLLFEFDAWKIEKCFSTGTSVNLRAQQGNTGVHGILQLVAHRTTDKTLPTV